MGAQQRREVLPIPKKLEPEPAPPPPEVDEPIDESDDLDETDGANLDAIVVSVESVDAGGYRTAGRVVNLVCPARQMPLPGSRPSWLRGVSEFALTVTPYDAIWLVVMLWTTLIALIALTTPLFPIFLPPVPVYAVLGLGIGVSGVVGAVHLFLRSLALADASTPATHLRVGSGGLEVHAEGHEPWQADVQRVQRVFTVANWRGGVRVRVQLDDGTEKDLLAGLSEEEAQEVVAQVDRALPGRQADS